MKMYIKKLIDIALAYLIILPAYLMIFYRRYGSKTFPRTTLKLKELGVFPIRDHYYEPLFDDKKLKSKLDLDRNLPGLDLDEGYQLRFLEALTYSEELVQLNLSQVAKTANEFCINNGSFESGDAEYLYQIIRYLKPKKIVEIGSGNSTKIARLALKRNAVESGIDAQHICIEPYEQPWLESLEGVDVIRSKIEDCSFDWSSVLSDGDLLFIDSSHVIRPQGDVLKEYLEIIPQLRPGVLVHVHDIFTPKDYLQEWIADDVLFWNEQYMLEAILMNSSRYQVVAALNFLKHKHFKSLSKVCPYLTKDREPGSFYFKVRK